MVLFGVVNEASDDGIEHVVLVLPVPQGFTNYRFVAVQADVLPASILILTPPLLLILPLYHLNLALQLLKRVVDRAPLLLLLARYRRLLCVC